jgi:hypothetical protein
MPLSTQLCEAIQITKIYLRISFWMPAHGRVHHSSSSRLRILPNDRCWTSDPSSLSLSVSMNSREKGLMPMMSRQKRRHRHVTIQLCCATTIQTCRRKVHYARCMVSARHGSIMPTLQSPNVVMSTVSTSRCHATCLVVSLQCLSQPLPTGIANHVNKFSASM